jgi:hypothetical protein
MGDIMALFELEKEYCRTLKKEYSRLAKLYSETMEECSLSLQKRDITKAIILRMKTYYETHEGIAKLLNRRNIAPAADFFVEAVTFYLRLFLEKRKKRLQVHSEKKSKPQRKAMKPDISIWKRDEVIAIIECKTNLGWNRKGWEKDFRRRERRLKKIFPKAKAFLLVLTSINWSGFEDSDKRVGRQFFCLSSEGMRRIQSQPIESVILNPVEKLFSRILKCSRGHI